MTAQDAEMVAAWQRARKNVGDFEGAVTKAGKAGKKAGDDTKGSFEGAAKGMGDLATSFLGVSSGIDVALKVATLFKMELDAIAQRQKDIAQAQTGIGPALRKASERLPAGGMSADDLLASLVQGGNGADPSALLNAFTAAASEGSPESARDTVLAIAKLRPDLASDQGTINKLAASAMQVQGQTGATVQQSVGGLLQGASVSNTENLGQFLDTSVKTALGLQRQAGGKGDFRELLALAEGFGEAMESPDKAATALPKLFAKMQKETGQLDMGMPELLAQIRSDPKRRDKVIGTFAQEEYGDTAKAVDAKIKSGLLDKMQGEAFSTSVDFLRGGGRVQEEIDKQRGKQLGPTDAATAQVQAGEKRFYDTNAGAIAKAENAKNQSKNENLLKIASGLRGKAGELRDEAFTKVGTYGVEQDLNWAAARILNPFMSDEGFIKHQARVVRDSATTLEKTGGFDQRLSAEEKESVKEMRRLADTIEALIQSLPGRSPQEVVIAGDNRPAAANPPPVGGLSDR